MIVKRFCLIKLVHTPILLCSGYMAPEYAMHGQFSEKSDVFSFGVLVLEVVSGQRNSGIRHGENIDDLLSFVSHHFLSVYVPF